MSTNTISSNQGCCSNSMEAALTSKKHSHDFWNNCCIGTMAPYKYKLFFYALHSSAELNKG